MTRGTGAPSKPWSRSGTPKGSLDIEDSELAREAWRSVKRGRIGLSFGYLVNREKRGKDGVNELLDLDIFEVTLTSVPANADARVLTTKAIEDEDAERIRTIAAMTNDELLASLGAKQKSKAPIRVRSFRL